MSKKVLKQTRRNRMFVDVSEFSSPPSSEYQVPPLLAIVLRVLQIEFAMPVRFHWTNGGWQLSVSPHLVVFQRLLVIFCSVLLAGVFLLDFLSEDHVRVGKGSLTSILWLIDTAVVMLIVWLQVLNAPREIQGLLTLLKQLKQVNDGLNKHRSSYIRTDRHGTFLLICYLIWLFFEHLSSYCVLLFYYEWSMYPQVHMTLTYAKFTSV